jgi:hypothetical protein
VEEVEETLKEALLDLAMLAAEAELAVFYN